MSQKFELQAKYSHFVLLNTEPEALFLYCFVRLTAPARSVLLYAPAHQLQLSFLPSCLLVEKTLFVF